MCACRMGIGMSWILSTKKGTLWWMNGWLHMTQQSHAELQLDTTNCKSAQIGNFILFTWTFWPWPGYKDPQLPPTQLILFNQPYYRNDTKKIEERGVVYIYIYNTLDLRFLGYDMKLWMPETNMPAKIMPSCVRCSSVLGPGRCRRIWHNATQRWR